MPFNRKPFRLTKALLIALVFSFNLGDAGYATVSEACDHAAVTASQEYTSPPPTSPANENQFPLLKKSNAQPDLRSLIPLGNPTSRRALVQRTGEI